jgi:hypothetical protein
VMDIVERSGTRLALPTGVRYVRGQGITEELSGRTPPAT